MRLLTRQEWATIIFLFIIALISGHMTFFDHTVEEGTFEHESIATILSKSNTVKTKRSNRLSWKDAFNNDSLASGDHIFTYGNSKAKLLIRGNIPLLMEENTLFTILDIKEKPTLEVKQGIIYVELNQKSPAFTLKINNKKVVLTSNSAKFKITTKKNVSNISVIKGELKVSDKEKIQTIDNQKSLDIRSPLKEISVEDPITQKPVTVLLSPMNQTTITLNHLNQSIPFSWAKNEDVGVYTFVISSDKEFSNILYEKRTRKTNVLWQPTSAVRIFWKVEIDELAYQTEIFSLDIVNKSPPVKPLLRKVPTKLKLKMKQVETSWLKRISRWIIRSSFAQEYVSYILLKWPKYENHKYVLEIFRNRKTKIPLLRKRLDNHYFEWINPPKNKVYWRIALIDSLGQQGAFSDLKPLEITEPRYMKPVKSVVLLYPYHRIKINRSLNKFQVFRWKGNRNIKSFIFKISKSLDFKKPVLEKKLTKTNYKVHYKNLPEGNFYWRVVAIDNYNRETISKRRILTIRTNKNKVKKKKLVIKSQHRSSPLNVGLRLSQSSFKQRSSSLSIDLNGTLFSGVFVNYQKKIMDNDILLSNIYLTTGKAFDSVPYREGEMSLLYAYSLSSSLFAIGGARVDYLPRYSNNSSVLIEQFLVLPSGKAGLMYASNNHKKLRFESSIIGTVGIVSGVDVNLKSFYRSSYNYYVAAGYSSKKFTKDRCEVELSGLILQLGISLEL